MRAALSPALLAASKLCICLLCSNHQICEQPLSGAGNLKSGLCHWLSIVSISTKANAAYQPIFCTWSIAISVDGCFLWCWSARECQCAKSGQGPAQAHHVNACAAITGFLLCKCLQVLAVVVGRITAKQPS